MKMSREHFEYLESRLARWYTPARLGAYNMKGWSHTRYLHDALYNEDLSIWICDNLYGYLNDSHIETALRKIDRKSREV